MSNVGKKISQRTHDVRVAAKERLIASSAYDTFKVFTIGNGTQLVAAAPALFDRTTEIVTIAHNLGYKPAYWVFADNPQFYNAGELSPYSSKSVGVPAYTGMDWACDATNLYLYFNNASPGGSVTYEYRYYIFYNELA